VSEKQRIRLTLPDDWHLHLRDGEILRAVLPYTERHFGRAIVMPNLKPPVITSADARAYKARIQSAARTSTFRPLMTLYLTENTCPVDVHQGYSAGDITALKLYPAGATTNSDAGVRNLEAVYPVLEVMQELGIPLLVHGEVVDPAVDIFDREKVFIERVLSQLCQRFPDLRVVLEHITTAEGAAFVSEAGDNIAATVTPHHLVINRNAMLVGGMHPHYYCLPVAKRELHRQALLEAVTSGSHKFFLGTDSAPHLDGAKESSCGCAGIFNVVHCLEILAQVFEQEGALDQLEAFTSLNGPAFYGLAHNRGRVTLERNSVAYDISGRKMGIGSNYLTLFDPGFPLHWKVVEVLHQHRDGRLLGQRLADPMTS